MEIIGLVGAIVSILSGIWAFISANSAKKIKKEMLQRNRIDEFSIMLSCGRTALQDVKKIGPTVKMYRGVKIKDICDSVQNFTEMIIENISIINTSDREKIVKRNEEIQNIIFKVSEFDKKDEKTRELGTKLYYNLLNIIGELNKLKKENIEG